jgi:hypothetical protein
MWRTVSFWTEKLTEVLIWSFPKIDVSSLMRIETQDLKNEVIKTQELKRCLTLKNNSPYIMLCLTERTMSIMYIHALITIL